MKNFTSEGASRRLGLGSGPINAGQILMVMPAIGILFPIDDDGRMEEAGSDGP